MCLHDLGFEIDLVVTVDTLAIHRIWSGHMTMADAIREELMEIDGPRALARAFPDWLALSVFAGIRPAAPAMQR
jgi:hypothetical protein